jgi:hypothetical protein
VKNVTHRPTSFAKLSFVKDGLLDLEERLLHMRSVGITARVKVCNCLETLFHKSVVG